ncbi:guanylate-binding protein [Phytophthora cinnamomi]|uniref:guanylate-binding protein n=1 Tax=Phytophthora cinnamomi TaxID=4785 RepID=UPI00355A1060|nr:guanylate-binding protein [Phytophthora cinnamomi]
MIASRSKRDVRHTAEEIIQRERKIRQQAQLAAEQALTAAKEAQKAILQLEHELDSKGQQLEQERMAREQAELHVAAQKAINASRTANTLNKSSPVKAEKGECVETMPKREVHELKTEDPMHSPREVTATVEDKSSLVKRPRDSSETQSPAASKKPRDPNKNRVRACQGKASKHKMSLKEARKAAQDEIEKRMEQRAKQLSSRK